MERIEKELVLKDKRGKKLSLRVSPNVSYNAHRKNEKEKWNNFYGNLYHESQPYNLVYEGGSKALWF